jgi:hypothetical protein
LRRSRQQFIVAPLCTGAVVVGDNIGAAMVWRRTIRISREIVSDLVNAVHLAGQLCDRLPQAAHRDRLDDTRFRDPAALTGLAMRADTAVAARRVADYGKRLFVQPPSLQRIVSHSMAL